MNLFINSYTDNNPERNAELLTCLQKNMDCIHLDIHALSGRPTYQDYFNAINKVTGPNDLNIIANSDIYFKDLSYDQFNSLGYNDCYALSRWDVLPDGSEVHYKNSGSQDTWIFRGPVKPFEGANFTQGVAGCDNKIAYLLQQAGYTVANPSTKIKTYHLHNSGIRHYNKGVIYRLPRPRINVPIT